MKYKKTGIGILIIASCNPLYSEGENFNIGSILIERLAMMKQAPIELSFNYKLKESHISNGVFVEHVYDNSLSIDLLKNRALFSCCEAKDTQCFDLYTSNEKATNLQFSKEAHKLVHVTIAPPSDFYDFTPIFWFTDINYYIDAATALINHPEYETNMRMELINKSTNSPIYSLKSPSFEILFDVKSATIKSIRHFKASTGKNLNEKIFSNYKLISGIKIPLTIKYMTYSFNDGSLQSSAEFDINESTLKINQELPEAYFTPKIEAGVSVTDRINNKNYVSSGLDDKLEGESISKKLDELIK